MYMYIYTYMNTYIYIFIFICTYIYRYLSPESAPSAIYVTAQKKWETRCAQFSQSPPSNMDSLSSKSITLYPSAVLLCAWLNLFVFLVCLAGAPQRQGALPLPASPYEITTTERPNARCDRCAAPLVSAATPRNRFRAGIVQEATLFRARPQDGEMPSIQGRCSATRVGITSALRVDSQSTRWRQLCRQQQQETHQTGEPPTSVCQLCSTLP